MPPREAIDPLALAYAFDAAEVGGKLTFRPRGGEPVAELAEDDLVLPDSSAPARLVRAQETELPREVSISFTDALADYPAPPSPRGGWSAVEARLARRPAAAS